MRLARTITAVLLPLALLGACGGDDDDSAEPDEAGSTTSSSSPTPSGEGTAAPDRAADQALADAVVLRLEDLGPGWSVLEDEDDEEEDDDAETDQALADCLQVDISVIADDDGDEIEADVTFDAEQGRIESAAEIVATVEEAEGDFDILRGDRFADCYGGLLDDELRSDAEDDADGRANVSYGGVEMSRLELPSGLGDEAIGYRATISITANGVELSSYADFVFFRRGRVEMTLSTLSTFEPLPLDYEVGLARTMDQRAASA